MSNHLTQMARELLEIEEDFPYRLDYSKGRPRIDDFELYTFSQIWGSTAARTYVLIPLNVEQKCFVYFAGRFAYAVPYSQEFMDDVVAQHMEPVSQKGKYLAAIND